MMMSYLLAAILPPLPLFFGEERAKQAALISMKKSIFIGHQFNDFKL